MVEVDKDTTQADTKLNAIVKAASKVFVENGYHLAKMDDIAKKAGTTKRTIYKKFGSKEVLFQYILKSMIDTAYARANLLYDKAIPFREQLMKVLYNTWDVIGDDDFVKINRIIIAEHMKKPGFMTDILNEGTQRDEGLYAWMDSAIQAGHVKNCDKYMASEFIIALVEHFAQNPKFLNRPAPKGKKKDLILEEICAMFICRYGNQP